MLGCWLSHACALRYGINHGGCLPLSPSERVKLIKEIATRLEKEGWSDLDLTLSQFSLKPSPGWGGGDKKNKVFASLERAPDQALLDLALHTNFAFVPKVNDFVDPPFWQKGMLRVFLSHLAKEQVFAQELQQALKWYGISGFVAHNDIQPTAEWEEEIRIALSTCDSLVALLHPDFHLSDWTDQEIGFAMGRSVPVFAVSFDHEPYGFIQRFQAFKAKSSGALARDLFDAYRRHNQTQHRMGQILVQLFEDSGSFDQARERIGFLEEISSWEPGYAGRIRSAVQHNLQVASSWGVAGRVEVLAKKWEQM